VSLVVLFRFCWKWSKRSPTKIMERTHEEATEALHRKRKAAILRGHLSRRRTCSPGVSRRSTPRGMGSWRRRGNNGRFVASRLREKAKTLVSGWFRVTDEVDYFRMADDPGAIGKPLGVNRS
jgi:hypothetical protein